MLRHLNRGNEDFGRQKTLTANGTTRLAAPIFCLFKRQQIGFREKFDHFLRDPSLNTDRMKIVFETLRASVAFSMQNIVTNTAYFFCMQDNIQYTHTFQNKLWNRMMKKPLFYLGSL